LQLLDHGPLGRNQAVAARVLGQDQNKNNNKTKQKKEKKKAKSQQSKVNGKKERRLAKLPYVVSSSTQ
jgi:hypothetical protein